MKVSGSQVTSPVAMWLHALEALLQRLKVRYAVRVTFRALIGPTSNAECSIYIRVRSRAHFLLSTRYDLRLPSALLRYQAFWFLLLLLGLLLGLLLLLFLLLVASCSRMM